MALFILFPCAAPARVISTNVHYLLLTTNAALSGEQREHPTLSLATFSTEADLS